MTALVVDVPRRAVCAVCGVPLARPERAEVKVVGRRRTLVVRHHPACPEAAS